VHFTNFKVLELIRKGGILTQRTLAVEATEGANTEQHAIQSKWCCSRRGSTKVSDLGPKNSVGTFEHSTGQENSESSAAAAHSVAAQRVTSALTRVQARQRQPPVAGRPAC
jgi:hypothetical protein